MDMLAVVHIEIPRHVTRRVTAYNDLIYDMVTCLQLLLWKNNNNDNLITDHLKWSDGDEWLGLRNRVWSSDIL